jgi:CRP/FNR family cyclic AMP-dependent transcriptional regulator
VKLDPVIAARGEGARAGRDQLRHRLEAHPFFNGMNPEHVAILAEFATATEFVAGQLIFHEGDPANCFYLILEGSVALEANLPPGGMQVIDHVGSGEVLGWSWLFPPYRWHFAARSLTPTKAIFFYGTWLRERCDQDPRLGLELMKRVTAVIVRRLQTTRQRLGRALRTPAV